MTVFMELSIRRVLDQAEFFPGYDPLLRRSERAEQIVLCALDQVG